MHSTYLTYDIGTTGLKTALVSTKGEVLAVHTSEYTSISRKPDWSEMPPETYWNAAKEGTSAVFAKAGVSSNSIVAIGFSSQGQTFVPIDKNGLPVRDFVVWTDMRSQEIADCWGSNWLSKSRFYDITGFPWLPGGLTLFKIAWFAEHDPIVMKAWKFLFAPDYLIFRLTGKTVTDPDTASMSGLFNRGTGKWEESFLEAAGIVNTQLPNVQDFCTVAGTVTKSAAFEIGIPSGVPVCLGCNDQLAGAIGAGNVRAGVITETTGTSLAVTATTRMPLSDNRVFVAKHILADSYYARVFTATSAIVLKWFRDVCGEVYDYDTLVAEAKAVPPGCEGLIVLPHFAGGGPPDFDPNVRGAVVGLTLGHTRGHLSRAIMESCACMLKECLQPITDSGLDVSCVRSLGGAARSDLWLQIKADMLGIPMERPLYTDAGSIGAAMIAAIATKQYSSLLQASDSWYRTGKVFMPNPLCQHD